MYKDSELTKSIYKPKDVSILIGKTTRTLRIWDEKGQITFRRNPNTNRRFMTRDDVIEILKEQGLYYDDRTSSKKDVVYARVSSHRQKKEGDLDRQVNFLIQQCDDLQNVVVLSEVGSGLNDKRKQLKRLIQMVMNDEVNRVFVTYKDRLTRFGFHYLKTVFNAKNVKIINIKQLSEKNSVEQELMEDMMSLIASFSGKLYGLCSKNKCQNNINN
jgi:predicted site-specific integrase-resolvase